MSVLNISLWQKDGFALEKYFQLYSVKMTHLDSDMIAKNSHLRSTIPVPAIPALYSFARYAVSSVLLGMVSHGISIYCTASCSKVHSYSAIRMMILSFWTTVRKRSRGPYTKAWRDQRCFIWKDVWRDPVVTTQRTLFGCFTSISLWVIFWELPEVLYNLSFLSLNHTLILSYSSFS